MWVGLGLTALTLATGAYLQGRSRTLESVANDPTQTPVAVDQARLHAASTAAAWGALGAFSVAGASGVTAALLFAW